MATLQGVAAQCSAPMETSGASWMSSWLALGIHELMHEMHMGMYPPVGKGTVQAVRVPTGPLAQGWSGNVWESLVSQPASSTGSPPCCWYLGPASDFPPIRASEGRS